MNATGWSRDLAVTGGHQRLPRHGRPAGAARPGRVGLNSLAGAEGVRDGAGASHDLVKELDRLVFRHGYQLVYSVGWALGERERTAIDKVVRIRFLSWSPFTESNRRPSPYHGEFNGS